MIKQLPETSEDWSGTRDRHAKLGNTFPWKRYFNRPLITKPKSLAEIQNFLFSCQYLSDTITRDCDDYWEPPDVFEKRETGDCEDHAIWAWRHLHDMGYKTRLVIGIQKKVGHAWVHIFVNERVYLLEATQKHKWLPVTKTYNARWSVERLKNKKFAIYYHS